MLGASAFQGPTSARLAARPLGPLRPLFPIFPLLGHIQLGGQPFCWWPLLSSQVGRRQPQPRLRRPHGNSRCQMSPQSPGPRRWQKLKRLPGPEVLSVSESRLPQTRGSRSAEGSSMSSTSSSAAAGKQFSWSRRLERVNIKQWTQDWTPGSSHCVPRTSCATF